MELLCAHHQQVHWDVKRAQQSVQPYHLRGMNSAASEQRSQHREIERVEPVSRLEPELAAERLAAEQ